MIDDAIENSLPFSLSLKLVSVFAEWEFLPKLTAFLDHSFSSFQCTTSISHLDLSQKCSHSR